MIDLVGAGATSAQRNAMKRRLAKLLEAGRIRRKGTGKGTRYFMVEAATAPAAMLNEDDAPLDTESGLFAMLSPSGRALQRRIHKPLSQRTPVGYDRTFLSGYHSNETFYLSLREREHLAKVGHVPDGAQPAGTYVRQILGRLLIDLSWNSSRLEGNTYSLLDTVRLFELARSAEGKSAEETRMILNHKAAIEYLVEAADEISFNRHTILNLHALLSDGLLPDPHASGRLRRVPVGIGGSVYMPIENAAVVEECFGELLRAAGAIEDPFEQAFFVIVQLPYLQPFEDVNKRVSRLAANIPFIRRNLSPLSFVDVSDEIYTDAMLAIYEFNDIALARDMFLWAYERSAGRYAAVRQTLGAPDPFRTRYREELNEIVGDIVRARLDKSVASRRLVRYAAENIPDRDHARFIELVETELIAMHDGNFARFRLRPSEYFAWKSVWEADV